MDDNIIYKGEMVKSGKYNAYSEEKSPNRHFYIELVPEVYYNVNVDRKGDSLLC